MEVSQMEVSDFWGCYERGKIITIPNKTRESCVYDICYFIHSGVFVCLRVPRYSKISNFGYPVPEITKNVQPYHSKTALRSDLFHFHTVSVNHDCNAKLIISPRCSSTLLVLTVTVVLFIFCFPSSYSFSSTLSLLTYSTCQTCVIFIL